MKKSAFLNEINESDVICAIEKAESGTSGEIRVHFEPNCNKDVMDRASEVFAELHMHKTRMRNGVLFYIAFNDRKFAVIGDGNINAIVPKEFWEQEKKILLENFKNGHYTKGICEGIQRVGDILSRHFPYRKGLSGELPNEISIGE